MHHSISLCFLFMTTWSGTISKSFEHMVQLRGVKPLSLPEMANLFTSLHLAVTPGIDANPNNLVACTTFYSESTRAMLCLVRVKSFVTLKECIKEHLVSIPMQTPPPPAVSPVQPQSPVTPAAYNDPGAMLAGLL
ncbi:hypothetical protein B296_00028635 [Ensete ventricosum]|uniref:Uncharacterized protein n=1 Tax=Ensete ventricosum TaxID=4639 RepID=A0A427AMI8_ENSVE|nr:hypothetical protein B296_00028635 [Ensete ventricosum]